MSKFYFNTMKNKIVKVPELVHHQLISASLCAIEVNYAYDQAILFIPGWRGAHT